MSRNFIVHNIKFNNGEPMKIKVPMKYADCTPLMQVYLRSKIFYDQHLSFYLEEVNMSVVSTTKYFDDWQDWDAQIADEKCDDYVEYFVIPMHASTLFVSIEEEMLEGMGDNEISDEEQAVFENLLLHLDVRFIYYKS